MEEKRTDFFTWVKVHKKQLIIGGISISAVVGLYFGIRNKDTLIELWTSLEGNVNKVENALTTVPVVQASVPAIETVTVPRTYTSPKMSFTVNQHIRTLAGGKHHSAEKAAEAAALGISLLSNQTLVDPYEKYVA